MELTKPLLNMYAHWCICIFTTAILYYCVVELVYHSLPVTYTFTLSLLCRSWCSLYSYDGHSVITYIHDKERERGTHACFGVKSPNPTHTQQERERRQETGDRMGKTLAKLFGKKDMRILMLGLDAAGKTSILPQITGDYYRDY